MRILKEISILVLMLFIAASTTQAHNAIYICTAADAEYFNCLQNLIGSIHATNFKNLERYGGEIVVFDIGLLPEQRSKLKHMAYVVVQDVERYNPLITTKITARSGTRQPPGLYSWKAVCIKQALEMYPYILYIDAGIGVKMDLTIMFDYIKEHNYMLMQSMRSIRWMSTDYVINNYINPHRLRAKLISESTKGILAGLQGLTRAYYQNYVVPVAEFSRDITNFKEDGSTLTPRHDQPFFSMKSIELGMVSIPQHKKHFGSDQRGNPTLSIDDFFRFNLAEFRRHAAGLPNIKDIVFRR